MRAQAGWSACFKAARDSTSPFPSLWRGLAGTPALSTASGIPAWPHTRGWVQPVLPDSIALFQALECVSAVAPCWVFWSCCGLVRLEGHFQLTGWAQHLHCGYMSTQPPQVPAGPAVPEPLHKPSPHRGGSPRPGACACRFSSCRAKRCEATVSGSA